MKYKLTKKCLKKNLIIPTGYRLMKNWEILKQIRTDKKLKKLLVDGYLWCNTKNGTRACWLDDFYDEFLFDAVDSIVGYYLGLRGVIVKKKMGLKDD